MSGDMDSRTREGFLLGVTVAEACSQLTDLIGLLDRKARELEAQADRLARLAAPHTSRPLSESQRRALTILTSYWETTGRRMNSKEFARALGVRYERGLDIRAGLKEHEEAAYRQSPPPVGEPNAGGAHAHTRARTRARAGDSRERGAW